MALQQGCAQNWSDVQVLARFVSGSGDLRQILRRRHELNGHDVGALAALAMRFAMPNWRHLTPAVIAGNR
jgi:hypothetical protein